MIHNVWNNGGVRYLFIIIRIELETRAWSDASSFCGGCSMSAYHWPGLLWKESAGIVLKSAFCRPFNNLQKVYWDKTMVISGTLSWSETRALVQGGLWKVVTVEKGEETGVKEAKIGDSNNSGEKNDEVITWLEWFAGTRNNCWYTTRTNIPSLQSIYTE